mmetsp:Transcript_22966/g.57073  ORF Transcript_22966/g.57073 Transcript_22966/m.57073 type:complete len:284 (+) Transcript_22966:1221-2072(+)
MNLLFCVKVAVLASVLSQHAQSLQIGVRPGETRCISDDFPPGVKVLGEYLVIAGGSGEEPASISMEVKKVDGGEILFSKSDIDHGKFTFKTAQDNNDEFFHNSPYLHMRDASDPLEKDSQNAEETVSGGATSSRKLMKAKKRPVEPPAEVLFEEVQFCVSNKAPKGKSNVPRQVQINLSVHPTEVAKLRGNQARGSQRDQPLHATGDHIARLEEVLNQMSGGLRMVEVEVSKSRAREERTQNAVEKSLARIGACSFIILMVVGGAAAYQYNSMKAVLVKKKVI